MSKRGRLRKQVEQDTKARETLNVAELRSVPLKIGNHQFRAFDGMDAAFGARASDYPSLDSIPEEFLSHHNRYVRAFSALFFSGGKLEDHGLRLKSDVDRASFFATFRALASSFDPKHEIKEATCAWLLAEHCEDAA